MKELIGLIGLFGTIIYFSLNNSAKVVANATAKVAETQTQVQSINFIQTIQNNWATCIIIGLVVVAYLKSRGGKSG